MSNVKKLLKEKCPNGVIFKKMGEITEYVRGVTYNKTKETNDIENSWKILRANNITLNLNVINFDDIKLINKNVKVKESQFLKKGDILICAGSGSKEHIGKVAYIDEDMEYTFGGFMGVIRGNEELNSRYLFHILTSKLFRDYLDSALNSTTINNLNSQIVSEFKFPVPPLEVQCEIVHILDNFTLLTAELTAELTARQQQYEFYRNKLLTFDESLESLDTLHTHTHTHTDTI